LMTNWYPFGIPGYPGSVKPNIKKIIKYVALSGLLS
jgi:hypothetical protein